MTEPETQKFAAYVVQDLGTHLNSIRTSTQVVTGDLERSSALLDRLLNCGHCTAFITQKPDAILSLLRRMSHTIKQTQEENARIAEHIGALTPILDESRDLAGGFAHSA